MWRVYLVCLYSFLLTCISIVPASAQTGTCEYYDTQLSTSAICSPFVSTWVYVSANTSQSQLNTKLSQDPVYQLLQTVKSVLPISCYKSMLSIACQSTFSTCATDGGKAAPLRPCHSMCLDATDECGSIWTVVSKQAPLDCAAPNPFDTAPWPSSKCSSDVLPASSAGNFSLKVASCPSVYAMRHNPDENEAYCSLRCPDPSYTLDEFRSIARGAQIATSTSCGLLLFLVASYMIDPLKRAFPGRVQLYLILANLGFTIGALISGADPATRVMCANPTTYSTQDNNSACAIQAFLMLFFGFASILWVFALAVIIYVCIVREVRPASIQHYEKFFHAGVWGVSTIFLIAISGTHSLNYGYSTRTHCFLKVDLALSISLDYPLFYIPMTIIIFGILFFLILAVGKLVKYQILFKDGQSTKTSQVAQRRIIIVTTMSAIIFGTFFGTRFASSRSFIQGLIDDRTDWVNCKVTAELFGNPYPAECDTETNPLRRSYSSVMFQNLSGIVGFWLFFGFGTDLRIYKQWYILFRHLVKKDFDKAKSCMTRGYSSEVSGSEYKTGNLSKTNSHNSGRSQSQVTQMELAESQGLATSQTNLMDSQRSVGQMDVEVRENRT